MMWFGSAVFILFAQFCLGSPTGHYANNGLALYVRSLGGLGRLLDVDESRIVGGTTTTIEQYPWVVSMQRFGSHRCGASIISPNRILTAAHCTEKIIAETISIRAGSSRTSMGGRLLKVSAIREHPKYDSYTIENDIAVMELAALISFHLSKISSIELPAHGDGLVVGTLTDVVGWGTTSEGGSLASQLKWAELPLISNDQCNRIYRDGITSGMVCAGYPQGGSDACQGDSGGPMTVGHVQIGVVSFGRGCGRPGFPGVYTRVAEYRQWIDSLM